MTLGAGQHVDHDAPGLRVGQRDLRVHPLADRQVATADPRRDGRVGQLHDPVVPALLDHDPAERHPLPARARSRPARARANGRAAEKMLTAMPANLAPRSGRALPLGPGPRRGGRRATGPGSPAAAPPSSRPGHRAPPPVLHRTDGRVYGGLVPNGAAPPSNRQVQIETNGRGEGSTTPPSSRRRDRESPHRVTRPAKARNLSPAEKRDDRATISTRATARRRDTSTLRTGHGAPRSQPSRSPNPFPAGSLPHAWPPPWSRHARGAPLGTTPYRQAPRTPHPAGHAAGPPAAARPAGLDQHAPMNAPGGPGRAPIRPSRAGPREGARARPCRRPC